MVGAKRPCAVAALNRAASIRSNPCAYGAGQADVGKNAARAAPILALAFSNQTRRHGMSGRFSNTFRGRAAGSLAILNCLSNGSGAGLRESGRSSTRPTRYAPDSRFFNGVFTNLLWPILYQCLLLAQIGMAEITPALCFNCVSLKVRSRDFNTFAPASLESWA